MATKPVLTTASTLKCAHGGRIAAQSTQHALTVDGNPVLLLSDLAGATISGCTTVTASGPPPTKQCLIVTSALAGASRTLNVNGKPVATVQARGMTDGVAGGPGTWQVSTAGQNKLVTS